MRTARTTRRAAARDAALYLLVDGTKWRPRRITANEVRRCVNSARRMPTDVHVYETTDRDGIALHVAHVHYHPGYWSDRDNVTEIYEIPTRALTDL